MLVSLEILLDLREEFKRGVPPTVAIESKLAIILRKASKVCCLYEKDLLDKEGQWAYRMKCIKLH